MMGSQLRCVLVVASWVAGGAFAPSPVARSQPSACTGEAVDRDRCTPSKAPRLRGVFAQAESQEHLHPAELCGPWELSTTLSGAESMWVELEEEGAIGCSSRVGQGREWHAVRISTSEGERWRFHLTLADKLSRPIKLVGVVRPDEFRVKAVDGVVLSPPKRAQSTAQAAQMQSIGEFRGYKLD